MNLATNPTPDQLATLLGACDDAVAHHVLWVATDGEVRVHRLGDDETPADFDERSDVQFRYGAYGAGQGYVGPAAAADKKYVQKLFDELAGDWVHQRTGYLGVGDEGDDLDD